MIGVGDEDKTSKKNIGYGRPRFMLPVTQKLKPKYLSRKW